MRYNKLYKISYVFFKLAEMPTSQKEAEDIFKEYGLKPDYSNLKWLYHSLSKTFHPDKPGNTEDLKFKRINVAYNILKDNHPKTKQTIEDKEVSAEVDIEQPYWLISISTYFGDGHGYTSDYSRSEKDYKDRWGRVKRTEIKTQNLINAVSLIDKELAKGNTNIAIILFKGHKGSQSPRMLVKYDNIEQRWYVVPGGVNVNSNEVETQEKNHWKSWDEAKKIILRNEEEYSWGEESEPGLKTPLFD